MSSAATAIRTALRCGVRARSIRLRRPRAKALAVSQSLQSQDDNNNKEQVLECALAAGVLAAAGTYAVSSSSETTPRLPWRRVEVDSALVLDGTTSTSTTTTCYCEPLRPQPKNVMLHRMRSVRARGLNDKYKVDWKTVLGEGAYGSVHPARLAATGEKVRRSSSSSCFLVQGLFM